MQSVLTILEAIKNIDNKIKFYQAGTSEMFGKSKPPQMKKLSSYHRALMLLQKLQLICSQSIIEIHLNFLL